MKRVIIVHCWGGSSNYCWYPQVKKDLEEKGFQVEIPAMPETNLPKLSLWLPKLQKVIGISDEELYLVGHSAGVITILKYLENLSQGQKIGGAVFVAGFIDDLGYPELKNFFERPLQFEKIKQKAKRFIVIHSDNDPYVDVRYGDIFKDELGHFSGPTNNRNSTTSLPDVLQAILKMVDL